MKLTLKQHWLTYVILAYGLLLTGVLIEKFIVGFNSKSFITPSRISSFIILKKYN